MIINMRVPDEAVKEIGVLMRDCLHCNCVGECVMCEYILGCECLTALRDACYDNSDASNYVCEVILNEE